MMNPQNTLELFCYRIKLLFIVFLGELIKFLIDLRNTLLMKISMMNQFES